MKRRIACTAAAAIAAALLTPGVSNAEVPAGCSGITEVRTQGIFWGSMKIAQVKLMRGLCYGGYKYWGKLLITDDFAATGYHYKLRTGLDYDGVPYGTDGTSWAPDKQVVSTRTSATCTTTLKAKGFVSIYNQPGGSVIVTPWNDTKSCYG